MSELGRPFLPPDLRRLIQIERQVGDPPTEAKRDVAERLDRNLGLGGVMLASTPLMNVVDSPSTPRPPPSMAAGLFGWKAVAGAVLAVVVGGAAALSMASQSPQAISTSSAQGTDRLASTPQRTPPDDQRAQSRRAPGDERVTPLASANHTPQSRAKPLEQGAVRAVPRHRAVSRRASPSLDTLTAERTLLDGARAALLRRDAGASLAAVRNHEHSFPHGQLLEERESMRVQALALAGDIGAAQTAGERFRRHFPRSMFLPVVEQTLEAAQ
jgi:hypothetical protein